MIAGLAAVTIVMVILWVASLRIRDASIVDIFWGINFVLVAWVYYATTDGFRPRAILLAVLVTLWGMRLSIHLFLRNRGKPEDYRYRAMRGTWGPKFPWVSLFTVFLLQAAVLWVVSLPIWQAMRSALPGSLIWLDGVGAALFFLGFLFKSFIGVEAIDLVKMPFGLDLPVGARGVRFHRGGCEPGLLAQ